MLAFVSVGALAHATTIGSHIPNPRTTFFDVGAHGWSRLTQLPNLQLRFLTSCLQQFAGVRGGWFASGSRKNGESA